MGQSSRSWRILRQKGVVDMRESSRPAQNLFKITRLSELQTKGPLRDFSSRNRTFGSHPLDKVLPFLSVPNTPKVAEAEDATTATTATTASGRGSEQRRDVSSPPASSTCRTARHRGQCPARSAPSEALAGGKTVARPFADPPSPLLAAVGPTHQRASETRERCSGMKENYSSDFLAVRTARASTRRSQRARFQSRSLGRVTIISKTKEEPSSFFGRESRVARVRTCCRAGARPSWTWRWRPCRWRRRRSWRLELVGR